MSGAYNTCGGEAMFVDLQRFSFWGNLREGYHLEYVGADWRIILKWILNE
jgi:hypothetical protein